MTSSLLSPQASVARECSSWHRAKVVCRVGEASPLLSPNASGAREFSSRQSSNRLRKLIYELPGRNNFTVAANHASDARKCSSWLWRRAQRRQQGWHRFRRRQANHRSTFQRGETHSSCVGDGGPRGSEHFRTKPSVSWRRLANSFEDVMANYHPPGIAGKVAGKSSHTQWAFPTAPDEIWRGPSPARPLLCAHNGRRCRHTLASSVLSAFTIESQRSHRF